MSQDTIYIQSNPIESLNRFIDRDEQNIAVMNMYMKDMKQAPKDIVNLYMSLQKTNKIHILATTYVRDCLMGYKSYNSEILAKFRSKAKECSYVVMELLDNMVEQNIINEEEYRNKVKLNQLSYEWDNKIFEIIEAYANGDEVFLNWD
jgi:hypothetical protein